MVTGLTWTTYVNEMALLAVVDPTDTNFLANLPSTIDYAELRIYQDLQLLSTVTPVTGLSLAVNSPTLTIPISTFITLQDVNVITPVGTSDPAVGTLNPCLPVTKEYLQYEWPSAVGAGVPNKFAMVSQNVLRFGPWADQPYALYLVGTVRPASLSASNTTTFISTYLPSLMLMASMIFISGYQRNFGRQSDDPQMSVSYEQQYKALLNSANTEEQQKKFQASGWSSMAPAGVASPTRG